MANNALYLLQDAVKATASAMSLPISPLFALGNRGYNERLQRIGQGDMPVLCYDLALSGSYDMRETGKAYLQYSTDLLFLDFCDVTEDDASDKIRAMHGVAIEFLQRIMRLDSFAEGGASALGNISFREVAFLFDQQFAGVQVSFSATFDPSAKIPGCA